MWTGAASNTHGHFWGLTFKLKKKHTKIEREKDEKDWKQMLFSFNDAICYCVFFLSELLPERSSAEAWEQPSHQPHDTVHLVRLCGKYTITLQAECCYKASNRLKYTKAVSWLRLSLYLFVLSSTVWYVTKILIISFYHRTVGLILIFPLAFFFFMWKEAEICSRGSKKQRIGDTGAANGL